MEVPKTARRMEMQVPLGTSPADVRQRIEAMEKILERAVTIPVLRRKVGLDAIVGLIPFAGDLLTAMMGIYAVWEARNLGLPRWKQWRMIANIGFDTAIGTIPVAGDLFDFLYRSNTRNLKIIRAHLDRHHPETRVIEG
ncbi:DUF4112 domain-containing protein [Novosphingobium sp.]|uniref:DUF4112 domain-containing protein n=1 Tax=Novosphingobium sp. TaxID=1874826 RepID=UPI00286D7F70|nr:DUF4112 domain-containing protein [Novosphingobium sp.]